jgi:hypothetical protein
MGQRLWQEFFGGIVVLQERLGSTGLLSEQERSYVLNR